MIADTDRLARNSRITLEICCGVKPGETVVIVAGRKAETCRDLATYRAYAFALAQAATELGAHPVVLDLEAFMASQAFQEGRFLDPVSQALKVADVVVRITDVIGFGQMVPRDNNDDEFLTASARWVAFQSNGVEAWNITAEEVAATRTRTERLMELLAGSTSIRVTSPGGTDFTCEVSPPARHTPVLGIVPLYGEVAISPKQGSENGVIVIDGPTQQGVRPRDELGRAPLRIEVNEGFVTGCTGDMKQIARLKDFVASGTPAANTIDEVGIPTARTLDNDTYWWADGTHHLERVHIALGNNAARNNIVHGARHMDGEINSPSVSIDGQMILENARFVGPMADAAE